MASKSGKAPSGPESGLNLYHLVKVDIGTSLKIIWRFVDVLYPEQHRPVTGVAGASPVDPGSVTYICKGAKNYARLWEYDELQWLY